jgi:hypothetical protein
VNYEASQVVAEQWWVESMLEYTHTIYKKACYYENVDYGNIYHRKKGRSVGKYVVDAFPNGLHADEAENTVHLP